MNDGSAAFYQGEIAPLGATIKAGFQGVPPTPGWFAMSGVGFQLLTADETWLPIFPPNGTVDYSSPQACTYTPGPSQVVQASYLFNTTGLVRDRYIGRFTFTGVDQADDTVAIIVDAAVTVR